MPLKPTCREVHALVSQSQDRRLTLTERMRMRVHLLVCEACTRFNGQMLLIRRAMQRLSHDSDDKSGGNGAS